MIKKKKRKGISDLTRDIRPTLETLLTDSIQDIVEIDKNKPNDNGDLVEYENHTFYYRVIFLFMQRVVGYYTPEEVEIWSRKELLQEAVLPRIEDLLKDNY